MTSLKQYREEHDMDFEEALDKAIHKRKYLIFRQIKYGNDEEKEDELSGEEEIQEAD